MGKVKKQKLISVLLVAAVTLVAFLVSYFQVLFPLDKMITDPLYQRPSVTNGNIKVIAIDEKTIAAYGDMKTWDRSIWADLINKLNSGEKDPAVIVLDIMFIGTADEASDAAFAAAAAEGNNVITAVNCIYKTTVGRSENGIVKKTGVQMVEFPYDRLKTVSGYGFSNAMQDKDGYIRFSETVAEYNGEKIDSLAVAAYKRYCEVYGLEAKLPKTYLGNRFDFAFAGKSGAYGRVSMCDVLDGTRETKEFAGSIVMVGAYAPGMQDAYNVAIQRGAQMYGVEIHANIIEALLEGNTAVEGNRLVYSFCVAAVCLAFCLLVGKMKVTSAAWVLAGVCAADVAAGMVLYRLGITIGMVDIPVFMLLIYGVNLGKGYLAERLRRRKIMAAFKKYMEPQIVDTLCKDGEFHLTLGGESREVAVLFVDIRGFTPMSESLAPEQVVGILNEYLALTTQAIFNNKGTLDKFIGDAAMAIFNAPVDLEDYVYHAVCAARDIAAGSEVLQKKLMEKFGKSISFGIGVNCGRAVVGNIGCDFRMDYTAIGDTVNTAARLESNAKPGQILISSAVYEAVKDRVEVTEVGVIPLKGKANGVFVYQVDKVL